MNFPNWNKKFKIVYFNYLYDLYEGALGSTIKAKRLFSALSDFGFDIKFFWLNAKKNGPFPSQSIKKSIRQNLKARYSKYLHEPNQIFLNIPGIMKEFSILKTERPDLLIVRLQSYRISAAILAKVLRIPLLLEVDAPAAYEKRKFFPQYFMMLGILELFEKLNLRISDKIFVVSNALKDYLVRKNVSAQNVYVIPNGADYDFQSTDRGKAIRKNFKIDSQIVIGFVGSFHFWHGVSNLLILMNRILKRYKNVCFLLVGDGGPMAPIVGRFIKDNGYSTRVLLTGFINPEEVPGYISAMDIVLAPYPNLEFFYYSPVKIFEYMVYGKVVIAPKIGQISEIIQHGNTGFLYSADNIEQIFWYIQKLIHSPGLRKEIGKNAQQVALQEFSWKNRAERLAHICQKLLN